GSDHNYQRWLDQSVDNALPLSVGRRDHRKGLFSTWLQVLDRDAYQWCERPIKVTAIARACPPCVRDQADNTYTRDRDYQGDSRADLRHDMHWPDLFIYGRENTAPSSNSRHDPASL